MKITFWGVRGSVPTPRKEVLGYGGNTTCVEVTASGLHFIIDAGTGIIELGRKMTEQRAEKTIMLFTHLHHDHTQGFPFFQPAFSSSFQFEVMSGDFFTKSAQEVLADSMSDPFFPVPLNSLASRLTFSEISFEGSHVVSGLCNGVVDAIRLRHPRDGVVGYRFRENGKTMVFLTDCEHYEGRDELLIPFIRGTDLFVHDTMYTEAEYSNPLKSKVGWGHSTIEHAIEISKKAGVKKLVCTHHEPIHSDEFLDEVFEKAKQSFPNILGAYEGLSLEV
ncbi:MAG: MBL fold metallo-hydrolase [Planctomycetota bacterium]